MLVTGSFGAVSLGYAFYMHERAWRARSWPSVEATIKHVSIKHAGSSTTNDSGSQTEWFLPIVEFSYTVRGRTYSGARMFVGETASMAHESALALVKPYREGMKVRVHYDPAIPSYAVLNPLAHTGAMAVYGWLGAFLLAVFVWVGLFWGRVNP
jgi:hypothetical protein